MTAPMPGAPAWVDLASPDLDLARGFYTALFGWTADESDGYVTFQLNGLPVAGAGPLYGEGQPTAWSTYLATDDADAVAARVAAAGGQVLVAPFDVGDQGRMAAFVDPAGAPFSVWQPGSLPGTALFDVPGSLTWNELNTRDIDGSKAFYGAVFGWAYREDRMGSLPYVVITLGGTPVGGIQQMIGNEWPTDMSPHWLVVFAVRDCDISANRVAGLGGRVLHPPRNLSVGRFAIVQDPSGGMFSILASRA
jgi:predicted enzyme related to lactoylglutathione lyase